MSYIDVPLLLHKVLSKFLFNKKLFYQPKLILIYSHVNKNRILL